MGREGNGDGNISYNSAAVMDIWKYRRLLPAQLDLLVQKIKRYQEWAKRPVTDVQVLAAFLGKMNGETFHTVVDHSAEDFDSPWAKGFRMI